jgi:NADH-quinone oxidoreductase subunit A
LPASLVPADCAARRQPDTNEFCKAAASLKRRLLLRQCACSQCSIQLADTCGVRYQATDLPQSVAGPGRSEMPELLRDYLPIVIFMGVCIGLGVILMLTPILIAYRNPDPEKLSAYECGFNAFDDARMKFDVRFYLVSILFIIFDLEVAFLFPWAVTLGENGVYGFWSMMVFLGILTIGFIYEWRKGALEWD